MRQNRGLPFLHLEGRTVQFGLAHGAAAAGANAERTAGGRLWASAGLIGLIEKLHQQLAGPAELVDGLPEFVGAGVSAQAQDGLLAIGDGLADLGGQSPAVKVVLEAATIGRQARGQGLGGKLAVGDPLGHPNQFIEHRRTAQQRRLAVFLGHLLDDLEHGSQSLAPVF